MKETSRLLASIIEESPPRQGWNQFLFGTIGQVLYLLSDEKWEEIKKDGITPCSTVGCDCHIMHGKVLEGLEVLREDSKKCHNIGYARLAARPLKN